MIVQRESKHRAKSVLYLKSKRCESVVSTTQLSIS